MLQSGVVCLGDFGTDEGKIVQMPQTLDEFVEHALPRSRRQIFPGPGNVIQQPLSLGHVQCLVGRCRHAAFASLFATPWDFAFATTR